MFITATLYHRNYSRAGFGKKKVSSGNERKSERAMVMNMIKSTLHIYAYI